MKYEVTVDSWTVVEIQYSVVDRATGNSINIQSQSHLGHTSRTQLRNYEAASMIPSIQSP